MQIMRVAQGRARNPIDERFIRSASADQLRRCGHVPSISPERRFMRSRANRGRSRCRVDRPCRLTEIAPRSSRGSIGDSEPPKGSCGRAQGGPLPRFAASLPRSSSSSSSTRLANRRWRFLFPEETEAESRAVPAGASAPVETRAICRVVGILADLSMAIFPWTDDGCWRFVRNCTSPIVSIEDLQRVLSAENLGA